jgi:hypothetical protein
VTVATFNFATFANSGSGQSWSNPGHAEDDDSDYAEVTLSSGQSSALLVCTGADLSGIPDDAVFTRIQVNIKAKATGSGVIQVHEVFGWDGSATLGINQVDNTESGDSFFLLDSTGSEATYERGENNWNVWWRDRLLNTSFGVAIRCRYHSGLLPKAQINHVQLKVEYVVLPNRLIRKDWRPAMEIRVAGVNERQLTNWRNEIYQPGQGPSPNTYDWHEVTESALYLQEQVDLRTALGQKRLCLRMPAGRKPEHVVSSGQWEPMWDRQRSALMAVIPAWLAADPEREVFLYLGAPIKDAGFIDMAPPVLVPDVSDPDHVEILERIYFPYRDCVGIRRFFLDAASPIINEGSTERQLILDLLDWARDNGMEFGIEAIPEVGSQPDDDFIGPYTGFARTAFFTSRDPDLEWHINRGDVVHEVQPGQEDEMTDTEWLGFLARYAGAGHVFCAQTKQQDIVIDDVTLQTAEAFAPHQVTRQAATSCGFSVTNEAGHHFTMRAMTAGLSS